MDQHEYISVEELIELQKQETRDIIEALLEDGSDPDSLYDIEHHLCSENEEILQRALERVYQHGFTVDEMEQIEEDGVILWSCDVVKHGRLDAEEIDNQASKLIHIAEEFDIIYDGWGTYYEGDDVDDEMDEDEE